MLSLERPITIDGVTVFRDHADASTFWYLPTPLAIARRPTDQSPAFSFIKYKPAVAGSGVKGGGFLMFESTLRLPPDLESRILSRVSAEPGVTPPASLAAAPFEEGTVQCIALNVQGAGGTAAAAPPPGAFNAVEQILGASIPSMDADNRAAFSLTLSQEGAIILEQAFSDGMAPVGVIYTMKYLAMRPSIDVEITADYERIFNHFSAGLEGQYMFLRAGVEAAFESLVAVGAITIKVRSFTDEADEREQERWALEFFREDLVSKWFEPTLTPGNLAADQAAATPLGDVLTAGREMLRDVTGTGQQGGGQGGQANQGGQTNQGGGAATERVQPAALQMESQEPSPLPAGHAVTHVPAAQGLLETLTITGAGAVVRIGNQPATPDAQGRVQVTVDPASEKAIEVVWPAATQEQVFGLFFDFDKPAAAGWQLNPPSPEYRAYVENTTSDPRFRNASGTLRVQGDGDWSGPERGADRLRAWVQSLPAPRNVRLDAYASHEHVSAPNETERAAHNLRLSQRRLDVALAVVQRAGGNVTAGQTAHGDSPASSRPGTHSPMGGDPDNRVVHVTGRTAATGQIRWRGKLRRPASIREEPPPVQPRPPGPSQPQQPQQQQPPRTPSNVGSTPVVASLKLKFVRQEERKKMTLRYNRSEAVRRTYAPQGFIGLLLNDLEDKSKLFKEIDLDDSFFREFAVEASIPIDFDPIGLTSAQLAIDYGDPAVPQDHKHGDFSFSAGDTGPKTFRVFMNSTRDIGYAASLQYHFNPQSGWAADRFSYEVPKTATEDRTLFINPYEHVEFTEIAVVPGEVDWEIVSAIDVRLEAKGYATPEPRTVLTIRQDSTPQRWRLRGARPAPAGRGVSFTLVQTLKDGSSETTAPAEVSVPTIVVHDLFEDALRLLFVPTFDAAQVRTVFIDVEYRDDANGYARKEQREVPGTATEPVRLRIALRNKELRGYRYRLTFVGPAGAFDQRAWIDTTEELIALR